MGLPLGSMLAAPAVVACFALSCCYIVTKARKARAAHEAPRFDREAPFQPCRATSASPERGDRRRAVVPSSPPPRQRETKMWESITSPLQRSFNRGHTARGLSVSSLNMTGLSLSPGPGDGDLSVLSPWNGVSDRIRRHSVSRVREEPGP